ncbi:MAG: glycosyltransferase, partial [Dinghuibacter sp.]|nr:glycosyltransferase [Dinghuibacter sp.]
MPLPALIIFIRNPILGKVKTRLAADTGNEQALDIYRELLRHTRETAAAVQCTRYLFYSDFINENDEWPATLFQKRVQSGNNLGERMYQAFAEVLATHPSAVIIGSDCYALRPEHIATALEQLTNNDV